MTGAGLRRTVWRGAGVFALLSLAAACASPQASGPGAGLASFGSEAELVRFLEQREAMALPPPPPAMPAPAPPGMPMPAMESAAVENVVVTGSRVNITNNQEASVDEGDIVKARDDLLVILRRGRLFTVSLAGGGLRPVDSIDAYPPGADASDDWYDEMVLVGDRVVVIGYSYGRGGTEINRFRLSPDGQLSFEDAHHLRSEDYYSSRNYASRVVGDELVFYTPRELSWEDDPREALPGMRRWRPGGEDDAFQPIVTPDQIYVARVLRNDRYSTVDVMHTVVRCALGEPTLRCRAVGVLGSDRRNFYVSSRAVYLWVTEWWEGTDRRPSAFLYRVPLDGGRPEALQVRGAPLDQFSFREDADVLNVLIGAENPGERMWGAEMSEGVGALLRIPLAEFGDGSRAAPRRLYRMLPSPPPSQNRHACRNRFVGDYALYGCDYYDAAFEAPLRSTMFAAPLTGEEPERFDLTHGMGRIEALGRDALVIGSQAKDLVFSTIDLPTSRPRLGARYVRRGAAEAESRSHGFFYRPDPNSAEGRSGMVGLPVMHEAPERFRELFDDAAEVMFLRREDGRLAAFGQLAADPASATDDGCVASCVDWYGDARPIFIGDRVFALLGYELVEGAVGDTGVREVRRVVFAPRSQRP